MGVGASHRPGQQLRSLSTDSGPLALVPAQGDFRFPAQIEFVLAGMQALSRGLHQQRQIRSVVSRPDVFDPDDLAALLVHDLHRGRTRGGRDPTDERRHNDQATDPAR